MLRLLAAPILGPIAVIRRVAEEAMAQHYDPANIMADFSDLKAARENDELDEDAFREQKAALDARLQMAMKLKGDA